MSGLQGLTKEELKEKLGEDMYKKLIVAVRKLKKAKGGEVLTKDFGLTQEEINICVSVGILNAA